MSTYRKPNLDNYPPAVVDSGFYCDIRYDASDAAPDYIGLHTEMGADTVTNSQWKILKFTYSGSDITRIQVAYGTWTDRASYF